MDKGHQGGGKVSAETWPRGEDGEIRIILAELAESSGLANALWARAIDVLARDPDQAQTWLVDLEIRLEHFVRPELEDTLKVVREGIRRLDAELPDGPEPEAGPA